MLHCLMMLCSLVLVEFILSLSIRITPFNTLLPQRLRNKPVGTWMYRSTEFTKIVDTAINRTMCIFHKQYSASPMQNSEELFLQKKEFTISNEISVYIYCYALYFTMITANTYYELCTLFVFYYILKHLSILPIPWRLIYKELMHHPYMFLCNDLTHWGRVTHICISNLTIIGSDNGLSPDWCQAITWTNVGILLIGPLETNFSEMLIEIHTFLIKKIHLKMSSGKWQPFCLGLNVLNTEHVTAPSHCIAPFIQ